MGTCRVLLFLLVACSSSWAQMQQYMVFFTDKAGTPHTIDQPATFLSDRSVQRRVRMGFTPKVDDLPVTPSYVTQVRATGAKAFFTTRWMNGVLIEATPAQVAGIEALPFVASTEFVSPNQQLLGGRKMRPTSTGITTNATDDQLSMLSLDTMHMDGYRGEGVMIAVVDSGYPGVDIHTPFQALRDDGRILMEQDFITNSTNIYQFDEHGTQILSIMAAESPTFQGSAPKASYLLFVTEDVAGEYRIEEYNWLFAAEQADSAGADIIQSSVGYSTFDDPAMDYTTAMLDGETAVVSKAASHARDRGIVVVASAGNEGATPWQLIAPPADAEGILAVGAVTITGVKATFSSIGPTADGRTKPDVVALGAGVRVIGSDGQETNVSGTSAAAPLVTGLMAGLIQANPSVHMSTLLNAVRLSATLGAEPTNQLGYGIPNYRAVRNYLKLNGGTPMAMFPNPVENTLWLYPGFVGESMNLAIYDAQGKMMLNGPFTFTWSDTPFPIDVTGLGSGVYIMRINVGTYTFTIRFVKV